MNNINIEYSNDNNKIVIQDLSVKFDSTYLEGIFPLFTFNLIIKNAEFEQSFKMFVTSFNMKRFINGEIKYLYSVDMEDEDKDLTYYEHSFNDNSFSFEVYRELEKLDTSTQIMYLVVNLSSSIGKYNSTYDTKIKLELNSDKFEDFLIELQSYCKILLENLYPQIKKIKDNEFNTYNSLDKEIALLKKAINDF